MNIKAVLRLTRIEHSVMLVVAVLAAELIVKGLPSLPVLALSLITPIFISMASFAINDYFDLKVDRINKKDRPLVNGELRPIDAVYVTAVCLAIGIAASALINAYAFAIALIFGILAMLYSYRLKGIALVGNAYIGFSMAIPFIFGSYVVSQNVQMNIVLVAAMIFISGLAREIHGTIRDIRGDTAARKIRSLPKVIGIGASTFAALLAYVAAVAISIYLFVAVSPFKSNIAYALLIVIADIMLLYTGVGFITMRKQKFYNLSRNISLAAMGLALIAILLAPI